MIKIQQSFQFFIIFWVEKDLIKKLMISGFIYLGVKYFETKNPM